MSQQQVIIGADVGTTGCRAVIYRLDGTIVASHSCEYPIYTPQAGWVEQDPEEIFQAFLTVTSTAIRAASLPEGTSINLALSTFFHSLLPVDQAGRPLHRLLTWADMRGTKYSETIRDKCDAEAIYARTGCMVNPQYPLCKILWFKNELPAVFKVTAKFISIKEYILFRVLGYFLVDRSIASATGLYNIQTLQWDAELLKLLTISPEQLSPVYPTTHIATGLVRQVADRLGVPTSMPIILGAGDGVLSNLGTGAIGAGQLTAMIGTSGAVRVVTDKPYIDPKSRTWCYNLTDEHWVTGVAMNSGGIALRWIRNMLGHTGQQHAAPDYGYELLTSLAGQVPAGSEGLIALPFFAGERAPLWSAKSRGAFFGLTLNHGKPHLVRATLEGVIFSLYSIFKLVEAASGTVDDIRASGSFTNAEVWVQIMADVFGKTINIPAEPTGSVYGAALLGLYAQGLLPDLNAAGKMVKIKTSYTPIPANHALYQEYHQFFERLYDKLSDEFDTVSRLENLR